jgi:hypothetical protein
VELSWLSLALSFLSDFSSYSSFNFLPEFIHGQGSGCPFQPYAPTPCIFLEWLDLSQCGIIMFEKREISIFRFPPLSSPW